MSIYDYHTLKGLNISEERVLNLLPHIETVHFAHCETIVPKGALQNDWFHLVTGFVNAAIPSSDGKYTSVNIYGPGAWFGEASFVNEKPSEKGYFCLTDARVVRIPRACALEVFNSEPEFTRYIARLVSWRGTQQAAMLMLQKTGSPALRTIMGLALFAESIGNGASHLPSAGTENHLEIPLKQATLASMCGVSRGLFSECVQRISEAGFIKLNYATLQILNIKAWSRFAHAYRQNPMSLTKVEVPELLALIAASAHPTR
jgi:CRP/FNR family cyclic AMP-dependent transcriptional regulator